MMANLKLSVCALLSVVLLGCSQPSEEETPVTQTSSDAGSSDPIDTPKPAAFVADDFDVPRLVEQETFRVVPLGPELVKIDFDAYMSSIEHLQKTFTRSTSWPREGITDDEAMLDMQTEQQRFLSRESFAYAVLTPDGTRERGCIYVRPPAKPGYDAQVSMWVTQEEFDNGFDEELFAWAKSWIDSSWSFARVAYPGRAIAWEIWDAMPDLDSVGSEELELYEGNRLTAEAFIDAFYSFDSARLQSFLGKAGESEHSILYYQGWAEGGNYKVLERAACLPDSAELYRCAITVQDDPVVALQTGFNVTDTFALTFEGTNIVSIDTSSNDQPIYYEARKWVEANMPEVMTGPCAGRGKPDYDGPATAGDCARAMTEGYKKFYEAKTGSKSA